MEPDEKDMSLRKNKNDTNLKSGIREQSSSSEEEDDDSLVPTVSFQSRFDSEEEDELVSKEDTKNNGKGDTN